MSFQKPLTTGIRYEVSLILGTRIPEQGWDDIVKQDVEGHIDHKAILNILMALCKSVERLETNAKTAQ